MRCQSKLNIIWADPLLLGLFEEDFPSPAISHFRRPFVVVVVGNKGRYSRSVVQVQSSVQVFFPKTPKTLKFILCARLQDASFDCLCPTHLNLIKCRRAALLMPNYVFTMLIVSCRFSSLPPILMSFPPSCRHHYVADSCWCHLRELGRSQILAGVISAN